MTKLKEQIAILLNKPELTDSEKQWLLQYLESNDSAALRELMQQQFEEESDQDLAIDPEISEMMLQKIRQRTGNLKLPEKSGVYRIWRRSIAAAALVGFLVLGYYLLPGKVTRIDVASNSSPNIVDKNIVAPGSNKAVLTLSDGSLVVLDDAQNGTVAQQGNSKVIKLNGKLAYNAAAANDKEITYNTIATPRGGQYQVELADGTKVWLNAASSIHFPTSFTGKDRMVEVSGEAYFEVAKNAAMPFVVKLNGAEIQVKGTHFNVMAYKDEATLKATLVEGAITFIAGEFKGLLKPGQQSELSANGKVQVSKNVNLTEVLAWKNGLFDFEGEDIVSVTRQLSRWYNVDILFEEKTDDLFYAKIPRDTKITDMLKALELTGRVHFRIEGRKIIVLQ